MIRHMLMRRERRPNRGSRTTSRRPGSLAVCIVRAQP